VNLGPIIRGALAAQGFRYDGLNCSNFMADALDHEKVGLRGEKSDWGEEQRSREERPSYRRAVRPDCKTINPTKEKKSKVTEKVSLGRNTSQKSTSQNKAKTTLTTLITIDRLN
jgi:hypothetical protein